jgi:6-phosphogluconolactonase
MSFLGAARAAVARQSGLRRKSGGAGLVLFAILILVLALLSISCGTSTNKAVAVNHSAYVTLPDDGSVLQLLINGTIGSVTTETQTPQVQGTSPTGLALLPSKKFLYAANSRANTISIFSVAGDGTLMLTGVPTPAGNGPNVAIVDPSGNYLLVTNNFSNNVSVFAIDSGTGALAEVAGSPFYANNNPTEIQFAHSGNFVYVTNPGIGMVTGFSFTNGVLTPLPGSPLFSGAGAGALVVDGSDRFLFVANSSASNPPPNALTVGNISGFNIDPTTGKLTAIPGSPFTSSEGSGPSAITIDPSGRFVYAVTPGSSSSIWGFSLDATNGQLAPLLGSPFSLAAGGLFVVFDPTGNFLYVGGDAGINAYTYNQSSGAPALVVGSPFATGVSPGRMVF